MLVLSCHHPGTEHGDELCCCGDKSGELVGKKKKKKQHETDSCRETDSPVPRVLRRSKSKIRGKSFMNISREHLISRKLRVRSHRLGDLSRHCSTGRVMSFSVKTKLGVP